MAEVFDLKAMVTADVSPFNKAMDSSADSVSGSLKAIHAAANAFIGSGFIRTFAKATKTAYEFGQVMADISSISDVSIKNLSRSIAKMENVYGKMSTIGDSIYETISSGIRGTEKEYIDFTKVVGQTAKSIRADLKDTSNVITTLTNAYGLGISDVQKLSDMLFVTVREGKAHGNELAHTLGLVTNTAAEAGVSLAEMSAVISILSRTQSASQSMIGFNQMLNALIKPTQEATHEAKKWGIELGATALQAKGLTAILTEMHEKVGGNVEAINAMLGNIRAMRAGTALTGKQFNNFIEVLRTAEREIGSGVAFKAFEKQTATAQQALKNLETQVDKTFIAIGKDFEPVTKPFIEAVESYLKAFDDSSSIRRWNTYLSVALLTFKTIKATLDAIKATLNSISNNGTIKVSDNRVYDPLNTTALLSNALRTNKASGRRTLSQQQLAQSRYGASMEYLNMATEANIDAVLQKELNPLKHEIRAMAEANVERMYNIKRDAHGNIEYVRNPSTLQRVDYAKIVEEEGERIAAGYRSARMQHSFVVEEQKKLFVAEIKQKRERLKQLRLPARFEASRFDTDKVRERYNRRFGSFKDNPLGWMSNRISGVTDKVDISPITKAISAVAGKLATAPMVISTAVEAFQFGKELGEKFKIADSRFAKWLSTLDLPFAGRGAKSEEELHKQETQNVATLRKIANNRLKTAVLSGDINESTAFLHARQIALAKTYKEVQDALNALKKDLPKPKEDTPENGHAPKRKEGTMAEIQARSKLIESSMVQLHAFNKSADFAGFSKISDDALRSLVDAISQEDLDSRAKQIKDKLSSIRKQGEGLNSIEGARMVSYSGNVGRLLDDMVTALSSMRKDVEGRKRRKEIEDSAAAGADVKKQMTDLYDAFTGAHSTFSEESTEAYRKRIMGTDTYTQGEYAFQMLKDAEKHLKTQEKALSTYMSEGSDVLTDYANNPLYDTEADANAKLTYRNNAELAYNRIVEVRESFRTRVDEVIKQSEKDVDSILDTLKLEGLQEGSFAYANTFSTNVRKEIDRLDKAISQTSDEYASKRLKLLRLKYIDMEKEAFNKAKENLKKTQEGQSDMVKGSFGVIKNVLASMSVTNKDRNATMTNDQLYHSVSMLSKVVGPSIVKRQSSIYARDPYGARDTRARARTEQQVLAGLDAYIMSQRQEEANVGKTVFDIYTFMKNNKQIVVGNK